MPKPLFPVDSGLNRKRKKTDDPSLHKQKSLNALCQFYGLDPTNLNVEDSSPWHILAEKLMKQFVPAFQLNASGNIRRNTFISDDQVAAWFEMGYEDHVDDPRLKKVQIAQFADQYDLTAPQVMHALERVREARKQLKGLGKSAYDDNLPLYFKGEGALDRASKNRKRIK